VKRRALFPEGRGLGVGREKEKGKKKEVEKDSECVPADLYPPVITIFMVRSE
jgi:hypothetical protein